MKYTGIIICRYVPCDVCNGII